MNIISLVLLVCSLIFIIMYFFISFFLFFFTVRRIEYNLKISGYDRPFSWDVIGLRTYVYVFELIQPKTLYSKPSPFDSFTSSKLIHEYKRPIDVILARLLILDGFLFVVVLFVNDHFYL